jgi:hypothetical protein
MPLQNRVTPFGDIVAADARGTMLGNRGGKFHRDDRTLGRRRWASHHWICCELHYKGLHHEAMGKGYTSLFFLDEVTALAAGHRPCFYCRRSEAKQFLALSGCGNADELDRLLQAQRLGPSHRTGGRSLPDGVMVAAGDIAFAVRGGRFLRWSHEGYSAAAPGGPLRLLTPPLIAAILQRGYQPRWHATAHNGEHA